MSPRTTPPARRLRERPDLDQLKRQAKELLKAFQAGDAAAAAEVAAHYHGASRGTFALHDAQLVLARAYGFDSWPKLKAYVDGVTVARLADAVRAGDLDGVRAMLAARPELVRMDAAENDEHEALHVAVLARQPAIVRLLMQHGADARTGIWPHRDATGALTLAVDRGYDDIAAIIREEEQRRARTPPIRIEPVDDAAPAADVHHDANGGERTGPGTARSAIAAGDADWLRARHAAGRLASERGLIGYAVAAGRPDMLRLLLELGLDPDESGRVGGLEEVVPTMGEPLRECAIAGRLDLAAILLEHGANPNTNVYAASSAVFVAYQQRDEPMIALLERHGARPEPVAVAELGLVSRADQMLAEASADAIEGVASSLLWGAIGSGSPAIVRAALARLDWPRTDPRWHGMLENGLYLGPQSDRPRLLEAFALALDRSAPDVRSRLGATILHDIVASRGGLTAGDRVAYATRMLDAGARLDLRDDMLKSTPLGWACRWGRIELVRLFLDRGADPVEPGAEPWTTPRAWAEKRGHANVVALLE